MWMMESYSLRATPLQGTDEMQLLSNARGCHLRLATSQYLAWNLMVSKSEGAYFNQQRCLICQPCRPTDGLGWVLAPCVRNRLSNWRQCNSVDHPFAAMSELWSLILSNNISPQEPLKLIGKQLLLVWLPFSCVAWMVAFIGKS